MNAAFLPATTYSKLASGITAAIMLVSGATSSAAAGDDLAPGEIIRRTQATYATMASYSDEGEIVATMDGTTNTTAFTIRLARTNFYRVEWEQDSKTSYATDSARAQAAWSSGAYHFLDMGDGPQNKVSREVALAEAADLSGGAAATIPRMFFNMQWGDPGGQPGDSPWSANRQIDEKVGGVDCYVLTGELPGQAKTLWIGKQDFLIRRLRTVTSADAMRAMAAKWDPEIISDLHSFTSTETHARIAVNKRFLRSDFVP
ncbi:MAG TPA: hypothetical protein VNN22_24630 [Verrucomicrobiae bacterium]|nr:hypothetical protein [Verrucomicrobiae bacterium]